MSRTSTIPPRARADRGSPDSVRGARRIWWIPVAVAVGLFGGLFLAGSWWAGPAPGASDPGPVVGWGLPIARVLAVSAGTLTVGWLLTAAFLTRQGKRGVLSRTGRRDVQRAAWAALAWFVAAAATLVLNHAMMIGQPVLAALDPATFSTYAFAVDVNIAFAFSALAGLLVAVFAPFVSRTGGALLLLLAAGVGVVAPGLAGHSHGLGDHGLALASGLVHSAAAAAWLGSLVAVAGHVVRRDPGLQYLMPRFSRLTSISLVALALSGAGAAYARVERPGDLITAEYGWLVVAKILLLLLLAIVAAEARRAISAPSAAGRRQVWRWLVAEGVLLGAGIGVAVAMTRTPNTRIPVPLNSPAEELLGFEFPPEPTALNLLGGWHPDPFWLAVCAAMLILYGWGVWTLRHRGVSWPWGRTSSWVIGVLLVAWSTNAMIAAYSVVSVGLHMLQHMILAMLAPVFLVLGAPVTLALRAIRPSRSGDRGPREWILWALHSSAAKVTTHPWYVLGISMLGLYGLYFTGLFPTMMSNHLGHVLMQVHFLASGFLFYWIIIGIDPSARELPHWLKMIVLLLSLSLHGFFGVFLMMAAEPLAQSWYGLVTPPWLTDPLQDTYLAGGIAWAFGEIPTIIVMVALAIQWARSDERLARRLDRQADRDGDAELRAYNERLGALQRRHEKAASREEERAAPGRGE